MAVKHDGTTTPAIVKDGSDPTMARPEVIVASVATTDVLIGAINETAPASDTASSGLNGRLQRIAQRITASIASLASLIALFPTSLGQKAMAASLAVTVASDQSSINTTKQGAVTDRSGTITLGGTAQQAMASNATRRFLFLQNTSDTDLWFNFTTVAVADQPSAKLTPGAVFIMEGGFVSTEAISIIGATTSKSFTAKEG